jgi:hypothetical protein
MPVVFKMFLCCSFALMVAAQSASAQDLPAVFVLGEDETAYERLTNTFPRTLLAVSSNDLEEALKYWLELMGEIDRYSKTINFEIKGMKVWLHVFWNEDGSIAHIGFFFLPNSRNIKEEEVKAFFSSFIRQYKPVLKSDRKFSHYTSVSFPVLAEKK